MTDNEPGADQLEYSLEDARWVWEEVVRVMALHRELADMYRNNSRDKRTIKLIWEQIDAGEAGLRAMGVRL